MMKKISLTVIAFAFIFAQSALCLMNFIEGEDYTVDFQRKDDNMAAVLHITFINSAPSPQDAEAVVKDQMKIYALIIESEKEDPGQKEPEQKEPKQKEPEQKENEDAIGDEEEEKFKNIIGSAWWHNPLNPEEPVKIKFKEDLSAYVYIGKTKKIVPFPDYVAFLRKERDDKKEKDKAAAAVVSSTTTVSTQ
ncbi:MAG: hypothetical protein FWD54_04365 [Endomicrobia bacterium]|nr:hypothetical protein [Endomicrobiia bacterium]